MCHSTENLYQWSHTNLARVSDDFYPGVIASHTAHLANCAYVALFMGELALPDWDMFHSSHPAAALHAAARAVSGGPVYVSDRPGRHDFGLLRRLVLPDGSVLRCGQPGRPSPDCLFADPQRDGATALKVGVPAGRAPSVQLAGCLGASFVWFRWGGGMAEVNCI